MSKRLRFKYALFCIVSAILTTGCGQGDSGGPRMQTVTGTITFKGEPLKEADLLVRTVDGKHAAGTKVADGKFVLKAPIGQSNVEVTAMRDVPGEFREENPGERVPVREQFIPAKYNVQTMLKLDVKPDSKDVKFDLEP